MQTHRTRSASTLHRARCLGAALTASLLAGCAPVDAPSDAGDASADRGPLVFDTGVLPDARDAGPSVDATTAALPNEVSARALFTRCRSSEACNPAGANVLLFCDLQYPGGLCRRSFCNNSFECGNAGACAGARGCLPRCSPTGADACARYGAACLVFNPVSTTGTGCFPSCYGAPPAGVPACDAPARCDAYSGRCLLEPVLEGGDNGEPCRSDALCRSNRCLGEALFDGTPTGQLDGYCTSTGRQVSAEAYRAALAGGGALPSSNCPEGSVVFPRLDTEPEGSPTECLRSCTDDAQCRAGYRCDRAAGALGSGSLPFRVGACRPAPCLAEPARCPAGTRCVARSTSDTTGVCARERLDAGVPADATSEGGSEAGSSSEAGAD